MGEHIGYGTDGLTKRDVTIAIVPIGYADGYGRVFGKGRGFMDLNNHNVPTIGNICMDMTMLDVTGLDCSEGDRVIVFGKILLLKTWQNGHKLFLMKFSLV